MEAAERARLGLEFRRRCDEPGRLHRSISEILYPQCEDSQPKAKIMYRLGRIIDQTAVKTVRKVGGAAYRACSACGCQVENGTWAYCPRCGSRFVR